MKIYLMIALLMLIKDYQCGPIEGVLDAVKDTSSAIRKDVGGLFSFGRSLIFGDNHEEESLNKGRPAVPSQGIIDKVSLKIHDVSQGVRETVQSVLKITDRDDKGHKKGLIKNVYDGVKNKVDRVKGFLLGDKKDNINDKNNLNELNTIEETDHQIVLNNKTSNYVGHADEDEKNTLDSVHNGITNEKSSEEFDGSGVIDIRIASDDLAGNAKEYSDRKLKRIRTDYDNFDDHVRDLYIRGKTSFNNFKQEATSNVENSKRKINENVDKYSGYATNIKDNVIDNYHNLKN